MTEALTTRLAELAGLKRTPGRNRSSVFVVSVHEKTKSVTRGVVAEGRRAEASKRIGACGLIGFKRSTCRLSIPTSTIEAAAVVEICTCAVPSRTSVEVTSLRTETRNANR